MKKAFVTGGAGFFAQHLVALLVSEGFEVICQVREGKDTKSIDHLPVKIVRADLGKKESFENRVPKGCIFFHCYSLSPGANSSYEVYYEKNVQFTKNVLEVCKKREVSQVVYISSCSIVGPNVTIKMDEKTKPEPDNDYGKTKLEAEKLVEKFYSEEKISSLVLRLSTLFGPGTHPKAANLKLLRLVKKPVFVLVGGGNNPYEFSYIKNVAQGVFDATMKVKEGYNMFVISDVKKPTLREVVRSASRFINPKLRIVSIPFSVAMSLGFAGEFVAKVTGKRFPLQRRTVRGMVGGWISDPSKAVETFGLTQKYSLDEAMSETVVWLKERGRL
jgi:GlcNAc-P-P-Und epimerase